MMNNYYFLGPTNPPLVASAFAPEGTKLDYELIPEVNGHSELPFELQLIKLSSGKKGLIKNRSFRLKRNLVRLSTE